MNNELRDLYQQVILDHNKSPKNFREIENPDKEAEGFNPLCGDHLHLYINMDGEIVKDISFKGNGCAISKASASLMTTVIKGKTIKESEEFFEKFHSLVTGNLKDENQIEQLGKLAVFQGVQEFPARVKCASLAWHTLIAALKNETKQSVTTE